MNEGTVVLEHLNFLNKVINELLVVESRSMRRIRHWYFSVYFNNHMITSSSLFSTVRKLSSWRRLRQLFYLMRLGKGQIKSSRQDRVLVVTGRKGRGEGKKYQGSSKAYHFCHREGHWENGCKHQQEYWRRRGKLQRRRSKRCREHRSINGFLYWR